jgi:adenine-specific DNA-methyltransferase
MLTWVGKRPLTHVTAFPAQHIETFDPTGELGKPRTEEMWTDWPEAYPKSGLLFHGDNKEVLAHLLANGFRGKVDLIYIDPPFDSGADYVRRVSLRGPKGTAKIEGEGYTLGEQLQYTDIWANDEYLQFMYERLLLLKELLSDRGLFVVHLDEGRVHYLKTVLDEVFGIEHFLNEVIWRRQTAHSDVGQGAKHLGRLHDSLLIYSKGDEFTWNELFTPYSADYVEAFYRHLEQETGRRYRLSDVTAPGGAGKGNPRYEFLGVTRYWRFRKDRMEELYREGRIIQTAPGAVPAQKRYLDEMPGVPLQSIWDDIKPIQSQASERLDFPTQKPEALLDRILCLGSKPGNLVLDCFVGSGTTAAVAQKLGRRWIGCDINKGAIQTTSKRIQGVVEEQLEQGAQGKLTEDSERPAQVSFTTWRVNDYDLQIQHNEAVNLACEHIGVERLRTDPYFDGTLGKSLVKIVPFTHPLSPVDLEELKKELDARPDEDRTVTLVCLGIELAAKKWIEDWNRLRRGRNAVNRMEVIELRSDERYGRFIRHEPARARVKIERKDAKVIIDIEDFISPTIVERLSQQSGVVKPKIEDWRAMVDCVLIDPTFDGEVFNIAVSDVPEKKSDLVVGRYEIPVPDGKATVAVKIIDMLGEEVLVTATT